MIRIVFISLLVPILPSTIQAQESEQVAGREVSLLGDTAPFATASRHVSFGEREEFAFYILWDRPRDGDGTSRLVVRREVSIVEDWNAPPEDWVVNRTVTWANGRTCPGLENAVARMEDIELPALSVPVLGRPSTPLLTLDGVGYELSSQTSVWGDRMGYDVLISSNLGTSLAAWVEDVRSTAEACWDTVTPPAAERGTDPTR